MQANTAPECPATAALLDWARVGEFNAARFHGDQRTKYEEAQRRIEQQWDNQPR